MRKDPDAHFQEEELRGGLFRTRRIPRFRFVSGKCESPQRISKAQLEAYCAEELPVLVFYTGNRHAWWLFRGEFIYEDESYAREEITALLLGRELIEQRKIDRAMDRVAADTLGVDRSRQHIPDDVKVAVWRRDRGRCVRCGSQQDLEYDHVIPHSMGGSDGERNLQLLCRSCNRAKGASIG